ncbi:hypothetical protein CRUP_012938 [Coryphaenoides rupestris]|nr:hypothetical protein CRUP_012938 [Coryphaenoides rupestris]
MEGAGRGVREREREREPCGVRERPRDREREREREELLERERLLDLFAMGAGSPVGGRLGGQAGEVEGEIERPPDSQIGNGPHPATIDQLFEGLQSSMLPALTCQLTREDRFSTIRRFSVRMGGGFRLKGDR